MPRRNFSAKETPHYATIFMWKSCYSFYKLFFPTSKIAGRATRCNQNVSAKKVETRWPDVKILFNYLAQLAPLIMILPNAQSSTVYTWKMHYLHLHVSTLSHFWLLTSLFSMTAYTSIPCNSLYFS